jgi:hypothetical protein
VPVNFPKIKGSRFKVLGSKVTTEENNGSNRMIPESCMKINEKFELYLKTIDCEDFYSKAKYLIGKQDDSQFYLIHFHPSGEPEAFICFVIKGSK